MRFCTIDFKWSNNCHIINPFSLTFSNHSEINVILIVRASLPLAQTINGCTFIDKLGAIPSAPFAIPCYSMEMGTRQIDLSLIPFITTLFLFLLTGIKTTNATLRISILFVRRGNLKIPTHFVAAMSSKGMGNYFKFKLDFTLSKTAQ